MDFRIYKLRKGTAVNIKVDDSGSAYCGIVHYGDRKKAAGESFLSAIRSARGFGKVVPESVVFDTLHEILHGDAMSRAEVR